MSMSGSHMDVLQSGVAAFVTPPREFVIHNASPDWIETGWDGMKITFPPNNVVVKPGHGVRWTSAKDTDGDYIPGTLLLADESEVNGLGGEVLLWSAAQAVRHILGINSKSDVAQSGYARRGLSLLPVNPTKALVARVVAGGKVRSEEWQVEIARQTLEAFDARDIMRKRLNLPELAKPPEYHAAFTLISAANERANDAAKERLGILPKPDVKPSQIDMNAFVEKLVENDDFMKLMKARIALRESRPVRGREEAPETP